MATVPQAFDLALQHHQAGRLAEAEALYRQILAVQPNHSEAMHYLGLIGHQAGHHSEAAELIQRALVLDPMNAVAHCNLGEAYRALGRTEEAITAFLRALETQPDLPEAHANLASAFQDLGRFDEAAAALHRALDLKPRFPAAQFNLGNAFNGLGRPDDAVAAYRDALKLAPDYPEAWSNLGSTLKDQGRIEEALVAYRRGCQAAPQRAGIHSNIIYLLHYLPEPNEQGIAQEYQSWNQRFAAPREGLIRPHPHDRDPDRRLRIGYVSPDFWQHVVGRNVAPLFAFHDHQTFQVICYAGVARPDRSTEQFRQRAEQWRSTVRLSDEALAALIRQDAVDILVDLSQHSAGNRLPVFARQPAPVQVSFAGYPESARVEGIGYRISDRYLEAKAESFPGRERSASVPYPDRKERVFLIESFWCYDPCGMEVAVNALPAKESGRVTFGSLNNFCKINEPLLRLWARVLREVKESRLVMVSGLGSHRQRTWDFLEREGVAVGRVEFVKPCPRQAYLELYHRLDIVLDTFPYNGHTTSLDALWMGVPVVSLAGQRAVSRAGLSQLTNLGLPELVAYSEEEYVEIATRLAGDLPRLAELRRTLRARMEGSVLMDAPRFARNIEAAYRAMWRRWCAETSG